MVSLRCDSRENRHSRSTLLRWPLLGQVRRDNRMRGFPRLGFKGFLVLVICILLVEEFLYFGLKRARFSFAQVFPPRKGECGCWLLAQYSASRRLALFPLSRFLLKFFIWLTCYQNSSVLRSTRKDLDVCCRCFWHQSINQLHSSSVQYGPRCFRLLKIWILLRLSHEGTSTSVCFWACVNSFIIRFDIKKNRI